MGAVLGRWALSRGLFFGRPPSCPFACCFPVVPLLIIPLCFFFWSLCKKSPLCFGLVLGGLVTDSSSTPVTDKSPHCGSTPHRCLIQGCGLEEHRAHAVWDEASAGHRSPPPARPARGSVPATVAAAPARPPITSASIRECPGGMVSPCQL